MSIRIMTLVWETELPDSEKIVLLALADCANDDGACWPSMATLARKCSKSDRTIQTAIKSLVEKGHMGREERPGRGCLYHIHPRRAGQATDVAASERHYVYRVTRPDTGEFYIGARTCLCDPADDPYLGSGAWVKRQIDAGILLKKQVLELYPSRDALALGEQKITAQHFGDALCRNSKVATPGTLSRRFCPEATSPRSDFPPKPLRGNPRSDCGTPPKPLRTNRQGTLPPENAGAFSAPKGAVRTASGNGGRERGARIPADWQPVATADLPDRLRAMVEQWPTGAYETEAELFVAYWTAESGAKAAKRDWGKAWINRIGQIHQVVMRAKRSGVTYPTAPRSDGPRDWRRDAELLEERATTWDRFGRPEDAADLRRQAAALRAQGTAAAIAGKPPPLQLVGARRT